MSKQSSLESFFIGNFNNSVASATESDASYTTQATFKTTLETTTETIPQFKKS